MTMFMFGLLTNATLFHKCLHILLKTFPTEKLFDLVVSGCNSRMTPNRAGVEGRNHFGSDGRIIGKPDVLVFLDDLLVQVVTLLIR